MPEGTWAQILKMTPSLADSRIQIEAILSIYRSDRETLYTSLGTKRSIVKAGNYAKKLRNELESLLVDRTFSAAGQPSWLSRPRPTRKDFDLLFEELKNLHLVLKGAKSRTRMAPGRKSIQLIDNLVLQLNWFLMEHSRESVVLSNKKTQRADGANFVRLCCRTIDLTEGQIDRAIKRFIAKNHRNIQFHGIDLGAGEQLVEEDIARKLLRARPRSRRME